MEIKFIKGLFVNKPSDKVPEFVKAKVSISADSFIPFLKDNVNGKGYINFDILESKDGKYYAKLDNYNTETKTEENEIVEEVEIIEENNEDEIKIEDIPF
jgi:hypothetical protein